MSSHVRNINLSKIVKRCLYSLRHFANNSDDLEFLCSYVIAINALTECKRILDKRIMEQEIRN
jgi:hypothetical protein